MTAIVRRALAKKQTALLFVNNRLEGYAPGTIAAIVEELEGVDVKAET